MNKVKKELINHIGDEIEQSKIAIKSGFDKKIDKLSAEFDQKIEKQTEVIINKMSQMMAKWYRRMNL